VNTTANTASNTAEGTSRHGTAHRAPEPALAATVIVPTTGDRGPLLAHSIGSVLQQTVRDLEVFVIGDGITGETRDHVTALTARDHRVKLFEFDKHESRGEPNRHRVLTDHARGRIVAYLCDRDLWLPDHVEQLGRALASADFAHTLRFRVGEDDQIELTHVADLRTPAGRRPDRLGPGLVPLSFAGHTLEAYRRLPWGWRTTPPGRSTDRHMWEQFLAEPWVRVAASPVPTVLTFRRGSHPGWSTPRRLEILEAWTARLARPGGPDDVRGQVLDALWTDWAAGQRNALVAASRRPTAQARTLWARARRLVKRVTRVARQLVTHPRH
jgi:glycosyltransferase involved in cell wall biosynthesis